MASSHLVLLSLLFLITAVSSTSGSLGGGPLLGGRVQIPDVKNNKEVQDVGRFSVDEHNKNITKGNPTATVLTFIEVLEAERQVVNGMKYFLKVAAKSGDNVVTTFDVEVVVPPGANREKQLVSFNPTKPGN